MTWRRRDTMTHLPQRKEAEHSRMELRLLIVDDHPMVREALRVLFAKADFDRLLEASTCAEAIETVHHQSVDVVLLDVKLPDGTGFDVLREIQQMNLGLPVLMHSFHNTRPLLCRSFELGANGYLVKGAEKQPLLEMVRRVAGGESVWTEDQLMAIREAAAGGGGLNRTKQFSI